MFKQIFIFTLLLFGLTDIVGASQITVSGDVYGLWDTDTVLVTGDIRIPADSHLTISPGVKVLFDGPFQMSVEPDAKIAAAGTASKWIEFKPKNAGGIWRGIRMESCCGLSILDWCYFQNAEATGTGEYARGGALYLHNSSLAIYNCRFTNCTAALGGGAIYCDNNSNALITDCWFIDNYAGLGGAVFCGDSSRPLIMSCFFSSNHAALGIGGGAIHVETSSPTISQNIFQYNFGGDGCIRIWEPDTTMLIQGNEFKYDSSKSVIHISDMGPWSAEIRNNLIEDNSGVAIFAEVASPVIEMNTVVRNGFGLLLTYSASEVTCNLIAENRGSGIDFHNDTTVLTSNPIISHNIVDRNHGFGIVVESGNPVVRANCVTRNTSFMTGVGIDLRNCSGVVEHNTVALNRGEFAGGGIRVIGGIPLVRHCIIYGNTPDDLHVLSEVPADLLVDSCDIQGGWPDGTGNVDIDPLFRDTAHGDFHAMSDLITTKPLPSCGNGIPDSMEIWIDPSPTSIDGRDKNVANNFELLQNHPNPFNPNTHISFSLPRRTHVRLEIYNTLGQIVRILCDAKFPSGMSSIIWDGKDMQQHSVASGLYLYRLTADEMTLTRKMLLLK